MCKLCSLAVVSAVMLLGAAGQFSSAAEPAVPSGQVGVGGRGFKLWGRWNCITL